MKKASHTLFARSSPRGFVRLKTLFLASAIFGIGAALVSVALSLQTPNGGPVTAPPYSGTIRDYLRIERDASHEAVSLQTSIVRLVEEKPEGLLVDLISAVHVGDISYYNTLNSQLAQYEAVLYELVTPAGIEHRAALSERRTSQPDGLVDTLMAIGKGLFGFAGQLESIDYTRSNFVHADLSPQQMMDAIRSRGDNELSLALNVTSDLIRISNLQAQRFEAEAAVKSKTSIISDEQPFDLLALISDPHAKIKFKRMLAEQFDTSNLVDQVGPTLTTILISDRNSKVAEVLHRQITEGKRKIAVFYGAAHMPDLERRIAATHQLKRSVCHWLTAWDLRIPGTEKQATLNVSER